MTTEPSSQATGPALPEPDGRSTVNPRGPGRRELVRAKREGSRLSRPYMVVGALIVAGFLGFVVYGFVREYVVPPAQAAVRVEDVEYTRGDVVNFIRFNQRLAEDLGVEFQIGNSLFEALQVIQDNELAVRAAPTVGVTVTPDELETRIESLLGFPGLTPAERADPKISQSVTEAKRQFLNRVGLSEPVYREIVRKDLFRQELREVLSQNVPRIQPQVHVYEIVLTENSAQTLQRIDRALRGGSSIEQVALEFSQDPNKNRNRGEAGWFPRNVIPELEGLFWGENPDGSRKLAFGLPSEPQYNSEARTYNVYVVTEFAEAREIDATALQKLSDRALEEFLVERRRELSERDGLWMDLNDRIYNWVNRQVKLASLLPTQVPQTDPLSQFGQ